MPQSEFFSCPHCGADVATDARFCRHCGADDRSGWSEDWQSDDYEDASDYAEDDFDYDDYVRREFPEHAEAGGRKLNWIGVVAILLILSYIITLF